MGKYFLHSDRSSRLFPSDFEVEKAGAENAVGIIFLIGWARVVGEHIADKLSQIGAGFIFQGLNGLPCLSREFHPVDRFRRVGRKGALCIGNAVRVGNVGFNSVGLG